MLTAAQTTNLYTQIYIQMGQNIYFGVTQFFFFGFTQSEKCQFWAFVKRITLKMLLNVRRTFEAIFCAYPKISYDKLFL